MKKGNCSHEIWSYEKVPIMNLGNEKPTYWHKNLNRLNGRESTTEEISELEDWTEESSQVRVKENIKK